MNFKYKAFISYSRDDEKYVKKLHTMLETYIIPKELYKKHPNLPKKLSPIFRDIEQLKSGDKLSSEIHNKLKNSENLIVVCSPRSAKSYWVNKEIMDFKKMYGEDRIFPIIIDGTPHTNDKNECFPKALKYNISKKGELTDKKSDILASNIIKSADGKAFAKIKLISGLLGVENDDLWNFEAKRIFRKRIIWSIIWSIIFMVMAGLTVFSWKQMNNAQKELYENLFQQGTMFRDYFKDSLKSKLIFAKALKNSNHQNKKNTYIAYDGVEKIKLINIIDTNSSVKGILVTKNRDLIISWGKDKTVKIWEKKNKKLLSVLMHKSIISGIVVNKNENKILSWSKDGLVYLWNIETGKPIFILKHSKEVNGANFSNNEKEIISWCGMRTKDSSELKIWNALNGNLLKTFKHDKYIMGAVFSKNSKYILSWSYDKTAKLWDINQTKPLKIMYHDDYVWGASFNKNNQNILTWSADGTVKLWNINIEKPILKIKHNHVNKAILCHEEKEILTSDTYGAIKLWDINAKKHIRTFNHGSYVTGFNISKNEENLLSWAEDGTIKLWNKSSGKLLRSFKHNALVKKALFNKDETMILSWSMDKTLKLWNRTSNRPIAILKHINAINGGLFDFSMKKIFSWGDDGLIKIWDINNFKNDLYLKEKEITYKLDSVVVKK